MERTWKKESRHDDHAIIPTPGSRAIPNPVQRMPVALGLQQATLVPNRELRNPSEMQPREASAWLLLDQRKPKASTTLDGWGKAPVGEGAQDVMDKDVLPQREPEAEWLDPNFPHYIQPRRTDVEERALPKKVVTTLVAPRIPISIPLLKDILPELARLKF